jgi:hypothetical protein
VSTRASHLLKCSAAWQLEQWARWPLEEQWPGVLDLYEAAAYRRIHPDTVARACRPDRAGKAALAHQRVGSKYRITRRSLDAWGAVKAREAVAA